MRLGRNQIGVLESMAADPRGKWAEGLWTWGGTCQTHDICVTLEKRGLVERINDPRSFPGEFVITPAGRQAVSR